jgi:hypothetical protein
VGRTNKLPELQREVSKAPRYKGHDNLQQPKEEEEEEEKQLEEDQRCTSLLTTDGHEWSFRQHRWETQIRNKKEY